MVDQSLARGRKNTMCDGNYDLPNMIAYDAVQFNWWFAEMVVETVLRTSNKKAEAFEDQKLVTTILRDILEYPTPNPHNIKSEDIDWMVQNIIVLTYEAARPTFLARALISKYNL